MYTRNFRMVVLAALVIAVSGAMVKASPVGGPQPEQAWSSKSGLVALLPQNAVQTTADPMARLLIEDAFSRYAVALDEGRWDVLKSLFTEDARVEVVEGSNKPLVAVAGGGCGVGEFRVGMEAAGRAAASCDFQYRLQPTNGFTCLAHRLRRRDRGQ